MPDEPINKCICDGWNTWHHPYTHCAAWCPNYVNEPEKDRQANADYNARGGFYGEVKQPVK